MAEAKMGSVRAARWLLPLTAVTAALVLLMIWYFAAHQY